MTTNETGTRDSRGVQTILEAVDVDLRGVARIEDIEGTPLAAAALELLPSCQSIVVLGAEIYAEFLDLTAASRLAERPDLYDLLAQHKDYLRRRLTETAYKIARAAHTAGLEALPLAAAGLSADGELTSVIGFQAAAEAAGLGEAGMSGLLVTREYGPRVMLNVCLTEAALDSTAREDAGGCRYCNVCVFRCPVKAIGYPDRKNGERYALDRDVCAAYVASAGGCTECMRVCPVASPKYD